MIYLDSSALLKLIHEEPESYALAQWLSARMTVPLVSNQLARVEVVRAARRIDVAAVPEASALLDALDLIPISIDIVNAASLISDPALRSLGALHLASAASVGEDLTSFLAYDRRLVTAARAAELNTGTPVSLG